MSATTLQRPPAAPPAPAAAPPANQPRWARPLFWTLIAATTALYVIGLSQSGTANDFYAAAVKSGTESWKAWLFGSLDSSNAITVDKPPASLWVMVLSARILGFSSFSMLLPQALMGVGTVALVHGAVKRWSGPAAGLLAGLAVALTPVAALMFRFNNPDAALVLLMTAAAYCVVRAIDSTSSAGRSRALRWMLLAGTAIGFAFLTKMAQGLLVLPAFGLVYLLAASTSVRARIGHLLAATAAMVVSAGWFIALVELWPAASRPYIGGSTNNSLWELAVGYNGLGRILGGSGNGGGGGGGGQNSMFGGSTGITRMFGTAFGAQVSWLVPAALVALVAGLLLTRRATRTDRTRAALVLWGSWLLVTMAVFSFMSGTIHPYYAVALVPAIGALVGIGGSFLWAHRDDHVARGALALMIFASSVWGFHLMTRDASGWMTWLAWTMLVGGWASAIVLAFSTDRLKKVAVVAVVVGALFSVAGTTAFTAATVTSGHTGSTPTAGPASAGQGGMGGGMGGDQSSSTELTTLLEGTTSRWAAATVGSQSAAGYILSTDVAVMAIGGFSGSDDSPTLAQFKQYVADGDVAYFVSGGQGGRGGGPGGGGSSSGSEITAWVEATFTATTVGGTTVYDLSS
ncbi:ArnT family glycosyltransferase [Solicola sp. PLA-1-18]|uniref:ArnT family glycosyltransferase n=1 Tax=Solicola sp. PLA-1-18 TaxID=3380532 RepID=UPI003B81A8B1